MSEDSSAVWPPPPENNGPLGEDPWVIDAKAATLLRQTRLCFWLSLLLCAPFQILTVILGFNTNRRAGKGIATGYIIAASIHLAVMVVYFGFVFWIRTTR